MSTQYTGRRGSTVGQRITVFLAVVGALTLLSGLLYGMSLLRGDDTERPVPSYEIAPAPQQDTSSSAGVAPLGGYLDFGATPYALPSGAWRVSASEPRAHTRSSSAAGGENADRFVRVDITVTNQTQRYVNVSEEWRPTLGVDGATAEQLFDSGAGVDGYPPSETVAPGRSITWGVAWALADVPATIQLGLDPRSDPSGQSHVLYQGRV